MIYTKIYGKNIPVYNSVNFPYQEVYDKYKNEKLEKIKKKKKKNIYNIIISFDTESSTILAQNLSDKDYSYTYLWGFDFGGYCVVGRQWEEFIIFIAKIRDMFKLNADNKIMVWVHNLSYDFTFMYQFLRKLDPEGFKIFATDKRKVLYCFAAGFEFRCSYKLTNMSLDNWAKKEKGVTAYKLKGSIDYKEVQSPFKTLPRRFTRYFIGDLLTTSDCIKNKLINDNRTLWTIPLTSTGYIREESRAYCFNNDNKYRWNVKGMTLSPEVYKIIEKALIGGDTHANRFFKEG